jgi:nucleoside-diphosphate-sugar epimerase
MHLAILGATSHIAKDLVQSFAAKTNHKLVLFARRTDDVAQWLNRLGLADRYEVADFAAFGPDKHFDAVLNFVGVGDPAKAAAIGASIFDVTLKYDELALDYLRQYPDCRYIFLSSGAAYGNSFEAPVDIDTKASIAINNLQPQDWYAVAKLHAECRHRALTYLPIIDIRVFNYFSHTQDIDARFFITDVLRAIRDKTVLLTSISLMVRDYLHPSDFCQIVTLLLSATPMNLAVDCYSQAPIEKQTLLRAMQEQFGLRYEFVRAPVGLNATGSKPCYYTLNHGLAEFGYKPRLNSLEGILQESKKILPIT